MDQDLKEKVKLNKKNIQNVKEKLDNLFFYIKNNEEDIKENKNNLRNSVKNINFIVGLVTSTVILFRIIY